MSDEPAATGRTQSATSPSEAKSTLWPTVKRAVKVVLAIAGAIGSLFGAGRAISGTWTWWQKKHAPETQFERTPNAGLEFWQGADAAPMFYRDERNDVVRVKLHRGAFVMKLPKVARNTAVEVCAWNDASIFKLRAGISANSVVYLRPGRGIADTEYSSGSLSLNNEARNYLIGNRLRPTGDESQVFVSRLSSLGAPDQPLSDRHDPLYLAVYVDRNRDRRIDLGEYE